MTILPEPNKVLGEPKNTKLPSPTQILSEQTDNSSDLYNQALTAPDKMTKLNQIIDNIPELPGNSESKKKLYKDLLLKGITPQESKEVLETLSGTHPHQEGGTKYYVNERGIPVPLKNSERPPVGYEVASVWGSKSDAADDNPVEDLAKTVANVLPSVAENLIDVGQTHYEAVFNKPSDFLTYLKNQANYAKFEKDPDIQKSILNTEGIDEFSDIADAKRWDFSPNTLWGTALGLAGTVGEMYVEGKGIHKGLLKAGMSSKFAPKVATYLASFMTNLGETRDEFEKVGITGRDKGIGSLLMTAPIAAIDAKFDLGGKILSNNLMKEEKNAFIKKMSLAVADRMADGELTGQALNDLAKATTIGYSQLAKKWSKETVSDVLQQGGEEAAQSFMLNAGEQLWDKLTDEEKKKFGTNAFSPESFAKYLQEGVAGLIGGAPTAVGFNKIKEQARIENQNNTAYGIATKGPEAVSAFKENVQNELRMGKLTPKEAADAIFQVDAYAQYNEELKQGGVNLNEDQKKQVFNLTFQKQNLMSQVPTEYEKEKLGAIQQSQIDAKKKMADLIQKDIDKIVFRETVLNDPNASPAAREEIHKEEERTADNGLKTPKGEVNKDEYVYEEPEIFNTDKRSFEEFPTGEWNQPTQNFPLKLRRLGEWLLGQPKKEAFGEIAKDNEFMRNKRLVDTFKVVLPNGKSVRFASSMKRKPTKDAQGNYRGHFREEMLNDRDNVVGKKVALKAYKLKHSGRIVVSVYNPDNGKHLGFVKERYLGNSIFNTKDEKELQDIQDKIEGKGGDETSQVVEKPTPEGPITPADVKFKQPKVILEQPTRENLRNRYINSQIEKHQNEGSYHPDYDKIYKDIYGKKFDRLNPTLYVEKTTTGQEPVAGTTQGVDQENIAGSQKKKVGKTRLQQKIKDPNRIKAMMLEVYSPKAIIMQHFIGGGKISKESIIDFYKGSTKEANLRSHMVALNSKYGDKYAPTIDKLAHDLWEENKEFTPFADVQDYKNELEEVIQEYTSVVQMAKDLISTYTLEEQVPNEEIISDMNIQAEKEGITEEVDAIQDALEKESDETAKKLADDQGAFNSWIEENNPDIQNYEGDIPFQKQASVKGNIDKVVETIKKALPKMTVVYNPGLKVAGYVYGDKIFINPNYAGLDTPIHEAGHVLIDAIGYDSPIIQQGIEQLKDSELWNKTKEAYPELNEEMLGKEVLAEAIGREGAGVFDSESKKNKFIQWLNYFFALVKQKLGLDKNIAKSLAKQIIGGIGTKELTGAETVQQQKVKKTKEEESKDEQKAREYKIGKKTMAQIKELENKSIDELLELQKELSENDDRNSSTYKATEILLGYKLFTERKEEITAKFGDKFLEDIANTGTLSATDVQLKALAHIGQNAPELQKFYKLFRSANMDAVMDNNSMMNKLDKLAKAVIDEKNKELGIKSKVGQLFSSDNAKYFDFVEKDGQYVSGAGLTKAQSDFLDYMKELQDLRNQQYEESGNQGEIDDVLKVDKSFSEARKTEGIIQAMSAYLGNSHAIKNAKVEFKDPVTGKLSVEKYSDIEEKLLEYSKKEKGTLDKAFNAVGLPSLREINAMRMLLKYNMKARRATGEKFGQYSISPTGQLNNKFLKPRDKDRGYSKDFYKAAKQFIADYNHTKHMSPLLPYIDSIETLNKYGYKEHAQKDNVVKYVQGWKDAILFKNEKQGKLGPEVDAGLRFLRTLTSAIVMTFNPKAGVFNAGTAIYNAWRAENGKVLKKGHARMFGGKNRSGAGTISKKAEYILKYYNVVSLSNDDINPQSYAGKLFKRVSRVFTTFGEYWGQGSMALGMMDDKDWDAFEEVKDGDKTSYKLKDGADKEAIKERMLKIKKRVSDIQGKYSPEDLRLISTTELGKAGLQFKLWALDWAKERLGAEYIDADDNLKKGTFRKISLEAANQLRKQLLSDPKKTWNDLKKDKDAMSNLKAAVVVAGLLALRLSGDDDEKRRRKGDLLSQALGNVMFIFDPTSKEGVKNLVERPLASIGTVVKFIDAFDYVLAFEDDDYYKSGTPKAFASLAELTPYHKLLINDFIIPKENLK